MNLQMEPTKRSGRSLPSAALVPKGKIVTKPFNVPAILHTLGEDGGMSAQYDGDARRLRERVFSPICLSRGEEVVVTEPSIYLG